jgi:DNA-binding NarL/FixJ family response regulator
LPIGKGVACAGMRPYLELWLPAGREIRVLEGARHTVGRHASNDLVLAQDDEVSRVHAVLEQVGPSWVVRDLSSRNGTRINGELVAADHPLTSGDELRIGSTRLVFRDEEYGALAPTRGAQPPPSITPRERDVLLELFRPVAGSQGLLSEPASTRVIAAALVVSEAAVKQHLSNLYEKFGIHTGLDRRRMRLANEALRRGAVSTADVRNRHQP